MSTEHRVHIIILISCLSCISILQAQTQNSLPHLARQGSSTQLIVDDKPFLILGGELGNSSASSLEYMKPIWPKLVQMNLNTVLSPLYWELIEPQEGKYDFTLVDGLIDNAREHNLRLVLLWFGSWKNSMSCYAPEWNLLQTTDWRTGLYAGGLLNGFERTSDYFEIGGPALFLRHQSASGWDNAFINFDHTGWFPAPNYVVMKLWHDKLRPI